MGYEVDFLPVGEDKSGDAITLRFGNLFGRREEQVVVVIDGGFTDCGDAVVNHLKTFYGTTKVDLVVSTHSDADHAAGLETVLTTCDVGQLWMHQPWNHTDDIAKMFTDGRVTDNGVREALRKSLDNARAVERIANSRKIEIVEPFVGVSDASKHVWVIGPSKEYYESLLPSWERPFRSSSHIWPEPIPGDGRAANAHLAPSTPRTPHRSVFSDRYGFSAFQHCLMNRGLGREAFSQSSLRPTRCSTRPCCS